MSIGSTIKKLRRERDMTQEQLAEYLGITANAVSQWECDRTAPDISQLPLLARVFNVTTDYLLGVDCDKDKERIDSIMDESFSLYRAGQFKKAAEIARSGLLEFPRSFELMARLADTLVCMSGYEDEVERLCEKIINECTEIGPKNHAYRLRIMMSGKREKYDEVVRISDKLSHAWASREDMLMVYNNTRDEKQRMELMDYAKFCSSRLSHCLGKIANFPMYTLEEKIQIRMQSIKIMQIMYPNEDYNYFSAYIADDYMEIAGLYSFLGKYDKALDALEKMCEYAVHFESNDGVNSSPAFRGYNDGKWNSDGIYCYCKEKIEIINGQSSFDALRGDPRCIEIVNKLSQYVY
ncbi:MAG: helix-turn-helix transcriptional regulator [Ruminococcaceae bacterium]|nr:helix-turn-helix transcriptional regulator [Oscillospiraceae bacterium]